MTEREKGTTLRITLTGSVKGPYKPHKNYRDYIQFDKNIDFQKPILEPIDFLAIIISCLFILSLVLI